MMIGSYTEKGYASEAAEAFAENFCRTHGVDYLTVIMDVDNPASRKTAEKSGFRLFEKDNTTKLAESGHYTFRSTLGVGFR